MSPTAVVPSNSRRARCWTTQSYPAWASSRKLLRHRFLRKRKGHQRDRHIRRDRRPATPRLLCPASQQARMRFWPRRNETSLNWSSVKSTPRLPRDLWHVLKATSDKPVHQDRIDIFPRPQFDFLGLPSLLNEAELFVKADGNIVRRRHPERHLLN